MKCSIAETIKSLPPLPKTLMEINRIIADPESSVSDLAAVLEHDPMASANLIFTRVWEDTDRKLSDERG